MRLASRKRRLRARRAEYWSGWTRTGAVVVVSAMLASTVLATAASASDDQPEVPAVQARFSSREYTAVEGGDAAEVTVVLTEAPQRLVVIPIESQLGGGATAQDYAALPPSVAFEAGETSKSFQISAVDDTDDDDGEFVSLWLGELPERVSSAAFTTVRLDDDDVPQVEVSFASTEHTAVEGRAPVNVTVVLSAVPERQVAVPVIVSRGGGADGTDYRVVADSVVFEADETRKAFQVEALADGVDETGESVVSWFGDLPERVSAANPEWSRIILEDFVPPEVEVSFASTEHTAVEGEAPATVTVVLSAVPEREVVVPIRTSRLTGADEADYRGVPDSVTFNADETHKTFQVEAVDDDVDESDESVYLWFEDLPEGVSRGNPEWSRVILEDIALQDSAPPEVDVRFARTESTSVEGGAPVEVTVVLSAAPEREVVVPIRTSRLAGADEADYRGVPHSVTFEAHETQTSFQVTALDDDVDESGESLLLWFGELPERVSAAYPEWTSIALEDPAPPEVMVDFSTTEYTAVEGGPGAEITVVLSEVPRRRVAVPVLGVVRKYLVPDEEVLDLYVAPIMVTFESHEQVRSFHIGILNGFTDAVTLLSEDSVNLRFKPLPDGVIPPDRTVFPPAGLARIIIQDPEHSSNS